MIKDATVTFVEELSNSVEGILPLRDPIKLDYTDPEAIELELTLDLRLKDSAGNLWTISPEDYCPIVHLVREDGV